MMGVVRVGDHRRVAMHRSALLGRRPGSGRFYGREQTRVSVSQLEGWGILVKKMMFLGRVITSLSGFVEN